MKPALIAACLALPAPALAGTATVTDCGPMTSARNVAEPWEENTLTFANGAIRVAILDTVEPAAAAFHLLVLSPPYSELGDRQCRMVSAGPGGWGFGFLSFERHEASYDPATGLTVTMDMGIVNQSGVADALALSVTINQATGEITGTWLP
ncbi:hypothetical protein HKCCE2091_11545 [Rhodobacterales bacterium HKCCE2091]|nr:hypothetical protein [Rhodobacterales bacterium HKCCE2091]